MPNYADADLVTAQARLLGEFESSETRFRDPVTHKKFIENREIMFPSHNVLRTREDRPIDAKFFNRTARALGVGGRTANHVGVKGDSSTLTPSWTPYDDKFFWSLKQADNSVYTLQEQLNNEIINSTANFAEGLETAAIDFLFNNRSGVNIATSEGTFNAVQDSFEITQASNGDRAIQITKGVMKENKYNSGLTLYCDTVAFNKFAFQANQGTANNQNLSFQFAGVTFVHSIEFGALAGALAAPYTDGFWIAVQDGGVAALDWIPQQNRQGIETKENKYATLLNPVDGLIYAVHSYEARADESANNGSAQDVRTEWEISIDIAHEAAPLTVVGETVMQAFALV